MSEQNIDLLDPLGLNKEMTVNKETGVTFKKEYLPKGLQQFVIAFAVPAGTHSEKFGTQDPKNVKKVLLIIESKAKRSDGKRFTKNRKWTWSMADKSIMYKDLVGLGIDVNKDVELLKLRGLNFMANVTHDLDKAGTVTNDKVGTFAALMEGLPPIEPEIKELPNWAKVYISESAEYKQKYPNEGGPYADAIKESKEKKAKFAAQGGNKNAEQTAQEAAQQEDDLPF